ncbi:MAG: bifunctional serine/threonine-protein kinase/formylglycine-generating enzyme family protein [Elusimicrobia bacterium]|nr:bifunctional serine/threonine-protein kinase/formylglycine-generating enzyme family protein [Elusimicrobiota bacterium]
MSPELDLKPGELLGQWRILDKLEESGIGAVYSACHKDSPGVSRALTVIRPELTSDAGFLRRFQAEGASLVELDHPHIVRSCDFGHAEGRCFLVTALVEGETLRARLDREKRLPVADAVRMARELCSALTYAHSKGVIHLLAEFGIVKIVGEESFTRSAASAGKAYMSPEQHLSDAFVGPTSDIYQVGAVLFESLTGRRFVDSTERPSELNTDVSPDLEAVILKCLKKMPEQRFESAEALLAALGAPPQTRKPADSRPRPALPVGVLAAVSVTVLVGGALLLSSRITKPPAPRPAPERPAAAKPVPAALPVAAAPLAVAPQPEPPCRERPEYRQALSRGESSLKQAHYAAALSAFHAAARLCPDEADARESEARTRSRAYAEHIVGAQNCERRKQWRMAKDGYAGALRYKQGDEQATAGLKRAADALRRHAPPSRVVPGKAGVEWVRIPGDSFTMGYGAEDGWLWSQPAHPVAVKSFYLAKTLVTNEQYKACVDAGACTAPHASDGTCFVRNGSNWDPGTLPASFQGDDQPVVCVDWKQAKAFSSWAGGRLPSEAEWEYAARSAGKERKHPWGDAVATCDFAVIEQGGKGCGLNATWPVCSKTPGNTEQGLCDMTGNAAEWVEDWYHDSYRGAPADGSAWGSPAASQRVARGGDWGHPASQARVADRLHHSPGFRSDYCSFRPAR